MNITIPGDDLLLFCILIACIYLSVKTSKLTVAGALVGGFIGVFVYKGAGFSGIGAMTAFFILGSAATAVKQNQKEQWGLSEKNKGRRTSLQVMANAGVPGFAGAVSLLLPAHQDLFHVLIAASFASATADTLSSELGNVYGRRFFDLLTLKTSGPGPDGVVSIEGLAFGFVGTLAIATVYAAFFGLSSLLLIIVVAGNIGNILDSVLGGSLQRRGYLDNNAVNFLNTLSAVLVALGLFYL